MESTLVVVFGIGSVSMAVLGLVFGQTDFVVGGIILAVIDISLASLRRDLRSLKTKMPPPLKYLNDTPEIWSEAISMLDLLEPEARAYDTSSGTNNTKYEDALVHSLEAVKLHTRRLICFDPKQEGTRMQDWLCQMLDPEADPDNLYQGLRAAIIEGRMFMLHLPYPLPIDFLITKSKGKSDLTGGFKITDTTLAEVGEEYDSGFRIYHSTLVGNYELLYKNVLWIRAREHMLNEKSKDSDKCFCMRFYDRRRPNTLSPFPHGEEES